ncbi:MAG: bifunctional UDP-N-acetylmuramoyl-tripeptide:D-alanyl-D-alanine ligase/alanine racemase [Bacteroidota bacterium]
MRYALGTLCELIEAKLLGDGTQICTRIVLDSRTLTHPNGTLFVAIRGEQHDGHDYLKEAYRAGVRMFILEDPAPLKAQLAEQRSSVGLLVVEDSLQALQAFAAAHRAQFSYPVVGITGSNGKTIVKEWAAHIVDSELSTIRNPRSYNSQVGVPLSVLLMDTVHQVGIFEAGISQPQEMARLRRILQPEIGVLTNVGKAHQENFSSWQQKLQEKLQLFTEVDVLIYCRDQQEVHTYLTTTFARERLIGWSQEDADAAVFYALEKEATQTLCKGVFFGVPMSFSLPFVTPALVEDALHAITLAAVLTISADLIQQQAASLPQIAMRLEMVQGIHNCTLINDTYNSDLNSLAIALDLLMQQKQHQQKTLILSDILQSGVPDELLYTQVSSWLKEYDVHRFIGVGPRIGSHKHLFPKGSLFFNSTGDFLRDLHPTHFRHEAVLLKGSRLFHFEDIARYLQERIHETALEVNLNHLVHNLNFFRHLLPDHVKLMVMVKAFSYGSGSYEIANVLQYHRVDYLGVAFVDEGITLRQSGIHLPIVVMNPEPSAFQALIDHGLEPEIYNFFTMRLFRKIVRHNGLEYYPVHLKLDSGMHRLGFQEAQLHELCELLANQHELKVASVFSHLAASDEAKHDQFTRKQVNTFTRMADSLEEAIGYTPMRHILNSSGIERFPHAHFDMVRLGIGLYGISPENQDALKTVSRLRTFVLQVKEVKKGETIGYGRMGKARNDLQIAILPVGYADGFRRTFSNGLGEVLVAGKRCPVVGSVCMDMTMVDITGLAVKEGDEVELFGSDLPVTEWAEKLDTIPYEIFTSVPPRVRRIYLQE